MGESTINCDLDLEMHSMRFLSNRGALDRRDDDALFSQI